jgi:hypothetical protein
LHVLAYGYDGEGSASVDAGRGAAVVAPTPPELLDSAVAGLVNASISVRASGIMSAAFPSMRAWARK